MEWLNSYVAQILHWLNPCFLLYKVYTHGALLLASGEACGEERGAFNVRLQQCSEKGFKKESITIMGGSVLFIVLSFSKLMLVAISMSV